MATIPSTNYSSADVILEAAGSVRAFNSNDADVRNLAGVPSGGYSSADWAGKSSVITGQVTLTTVGYASSGEGTIYQGYFTQAGVIRGSLSTTAWGGGTITNLSTWEDTWNEYPDELLFSLAGGATLSAVDLLISGNTPRRLTKTSTVGNVQNFSRVWDSWSDPYVIGLKTKNTVFTITGVV